MPAQAMRDRHWLALIFQLRGSVIPRVLPEVLTTALLGLVAAALHAARVDLTAFGPGAPARPSGAVLPDKAHTLLMVPLSFMLVFRSSHAYGRYWEGRSLVGQMVLSLREIVRIVSAYHDGDDRDAANEREDLRRLALLLYSAAAHDLQAAVADGLHAPAAAVAADGAVGACAPAAPGGAAWAGAGQRAWAAASGGGGAACAGARPSDGPTPPPKPAARPSAAPSARARAARARALEAEACARRFATAGEWSLLLAHERAVPVAAQWLSRRVHHAVRAGRLSGDALRLLDGHVTKLVGGWMGADKIRTTPLPSPYVQLLHLFLLLFLSTLPLTLAHHFGWGTPLASALVALALLGLNEVAAEIEMPFGVDRNDLRLDAFSKVARADALAVLAQRDGEGAGVVRFDAGAAPADADAARASALAKPRAGGAAHSARAAGGRSARSVAAGARAGSVGAGGGAAAANGYLQLPA